MLLYPLSSNSVELIKSREHVRRRCIVTAILLRYTTLTYSLRGDLYWRRCRPTRQRMFGYPVDLPSYAHDHHIII